MSNESEGELNVWFLCHQVTEVFWSHFLIHRDDAQDNTIRWESREDENQGKKEYEAKGKDKLVLVGRKRE